MTIDGKRVIGEIKTTTPYKGNELGAQQQATFVKDFKKLLAPSAEFKFFFVTDPAAYEVMERKYKPQIPGVEVVLLTNSQDPGSPWLRELYEYFAPVRQEILELGISEEEVIADIETAVAEVRAENRPRRREPN
jgi:hypothetical protein